MRKGGLPDICCNVFNSMLLLRLSFNKSSNLVLFYPQLLWGAKAWATFNPGTPPPLTYSWLAFLPCYECSLPSPTHFPLFSFLASIIVLSSFDREW
ncbi:conserved hypothetical protein [Ricinus communis]|uniref:Uncharacterized protein n=1 Tax=Ricinus communis TaxID=3988 RepID=B9T6I7_RICCO|nr:conserved hypothetical protein [Ricinus communis]